ncbi:hypothetical protein LshimejAT787_0410120 [Lyophyllum shimeji]|uniref:Uncharacterized protein n=1 Tax=Lyophyllum shimeji TaxID=47721 RepID=A0A9P3UP57_LYOSH|nr:hypothetical protein LshimejAT787_0410120 [Lyophyllum shimeji]
MLEHQHSLGQQERHAPEKHTLGQRRFDRMDFLHCLLDLARPESRRGRSAGQELPLPNVEQWYTYILATLATYKFWNSPQSDYSGTIDQMPSRLAGMDAQRFDLSKTSMNSAISLVTQATSGHDDLPQVRGSVSYLQLPPTSDGCANSFTDSTASTEETFADADRFIPVLQPSFSSLRLESMDAQRYDLSKSRHRRAPSSISTDVSRPSTACSSPTSELDSDSASSTDRSLTASTPPTTESFASITLEDGASQVGQDADKIHDTSADSVTDTEEHTTTCTIIRPAPRSPIIEFFSRPSSPVTSRPSSPINFGALNCFGSTHAFEDDVDYMQAQRAKELTGDRDLRVFVTQTRAVYREEAWRGAVQTMLYGESGEEGQGGAVVERGD